MIFGTHRRAALLWLSCATLAVGCATGGPSAPSSVTGTATYRERIALPPEAVFEATLEDVSRADAPSVAVGSARVESPRVPIDFSIAVDPARIEAGRRYAVRARITVNGAPVFVTDTAVPVSGSSSARHVDLLLRRTDSPGASSARMLGLYTYMADAASFVDCEGGVRMNVAQEGDHADLQRAYLTARTAPGVAVLATVQGRVVMRPGDAGGAPRPTLVVERFIAVSASPRIDCPRPP
jgi:putative lipoprotein